MFKVESLKILQQYIDGKKTRVKQKQKSYFKKLKFRSNNNVVYP